MTATSHTIGLLFSNPADRQMLADFLQELGYRVRAPEPLEARLAGWNDVSLIIADREAGRWHGAALLALKARSPAVLLPLLVALPHQEDGASWLEAGFDDVLRLPLTKVELQTRLNMFLRLREQSAELARRGELMFRGLVEQSLVGVYLIASDRFTYVNDALADVFGYKANEIIGRLGPLDLTHPDDRQRVEQLVTARLRGEIRSAHYEFRGLRKSGQIIHCEVFGRTIEYQGRHAILGTLVDITERKRAEEALQQYMGRLQLLREIDQAILKARLPEEVAQAALERIEKLVPFDRGSISAFDLKARESITLAAYPVGERQVCSDRFPLEPVWNIVETMRKGRVYVVHDVLALSQLSPVDRGLQALGLRSYISVPLIVQGELVGNLNLQAREPAAFGEEQIEIAQEVAGPLAVALHNARLEAESRQQAQRLAIVVRVGQASGTTLDLPAICDIAHEQISALVDCPNFGLFTYDESTRQIYPLYLKGNGNHLDVSNLPAIPLEPDTGPQSRAIVTRRPVIVPDLQAQRRNIKSYQDLPTDDRRLARSMLVVPLMIGEQVIGTLQVQSYQAGLYTEEDAELLSGVANQVALAIQNARLYERVQRHAEELERRVAERTAELTERVEEIENLNRALTNLLEDLQQANRMATETARRLEEANAELEAFAYSVSHDLRAPLRAMQGFANALLEDYADRLDTAGQEFAQRIIAAAHRMDRLIEDLLAYSRLTRAEIQRRPVRLEQVVDEVLSQLEESIRRRGARVAVERPLASVLSDRTILIQVLSNLVSNAIKFVDPGVQPHVRIWAQNQNGYVRLWVEDNGIGIAPEHQERIFRVFERLHGIEAYPGTGIGLAIVKKSVERMGGRVGVESDVGKGSRFWLDLPTAGDVEA